MGLTSRGGGVVNRVVKMGRFYPKNGTRKLLVKQKKNVFRQDNLP